MRMHFSSKPIATTEIFAHAVRGVLIRGAILILLSGVAVGVMWTINAREGSAIIALRKERAAVNQGINRISIISGQNELAGVLEKDLQAALPTDFDAVVETSRELKAMAAARKVRAQADLGEKGTGTTGAPRIQLRIRADGSLANLTAFLSDIEMNKKFYTIETFTISQIGAGEFQLVIQGAVYIREEKKTP
jgi:hypothetical protein